LKFLFIKYGSESIINFNFRQAVINLYLGDNARTDAISNRLRDVCPSLYNNDDAIASKAQEILIAAKRQNNQREKEKMIRDAIALCKDVAAKLNLDVLVNTAFSKLTIFSCPYRLKINLR
jgi:hypothetical protein